MIMVKPLAVSMLNVAHLIDTGIQVSFVFICNFLDVCVLMS